MAKLASTLLNEDTFWQIIERSDKGKNLDALLDALGEDEIFGFHYWWTYLKIKAYDQALWAVAHIVMRGCSDDSFEYFRRWLLTRGKEVYYKALENADSLCCEFDGITKRPTWETIEHVIMDNYERRFHRNFFEAENDYTYDKIEENWFKIEFAWQGDDEESLRRICPKTFEKWWDRDRPWWE